MTHDELLAKIDSLTYMLMENEVPSGYKALRAVVELHKPKPYDHNEELHFSCSCNPNVFGFLNPYPCPTIQAIEKELE